MLSIDKNLSITELSEPSTNELNANYNSIYDKIIKIANISGELSLYALLVALQPYWINDNGG